ncbi:hydrogenase expression/formation protein HypE [Aquabacterium sp. A7-Y]|uniref:hydrogenase expression/formation protein HypE n=1 Tax=Aquabacterium sp. A7-Y TaxID=1349605 RepID=UPI00223D1792|nr:hydrogenase expression/formation protein HypE [Aquabacterium sp. A7-Y]MCW7541124.1 hydrogenase expression/formation protein HypE [Aquabacterium sp. A7-Y]
MTTGRPRRSRLDLQEGRVELCHGAGGRATRQLIAEVFQAALDNEWLRQGNDHALLPPMQGPLVMTTDAYVVSPLFFPGGDIGRLAVHGTVNDLAMGGAQPLWLSASFIIEEGFALADLQRIADSMGRAAREAAVAVVAGDTKVVERGKGDGVFVSMTGVGCVLPGVHVSGDRARPGDVVLVSGTLGDHGVAVMSGRENLGFDTHIVSDSAALHGLVAAMAARHGPALHCLRDPTRGGLAATLNELACQSGVGIVLDEAALPVRREVAAACELLGLDPLNVANEGKLVAIVAEEAGPGVLASMRSHPLGREAALIGTVVTDAQQLVRMSTGFGGERVVDWLWGEQLPRIC